MEAIQVGWLSILPPLIAIALALITKEVISSLMIGILSGTLIYSIFQFSGVSGIFLGTIDTTFSLMTTKMGENAYIIMFLALLGALVVLVTRAGGSKAYGEWASRKITSRAGAQLSTSALGALIFIDDYFNCLTVGTVMKPVTDKQQISREKLAYIIDATAAPICIIAPVSSWAAAIISQIDATGLNGMSTFLSTIPYNLYAVLTILMLISLSFVNLEFGPMARFEQRARAPKPTQHTSSSKSVKTDFDNMEISSKGKVYDLLIPIAALIVFSILAMLYVGGFFEGGMSIAEAFGNTDAAKACTLGGFGALVVTLLLVIPRKVLSFREAMDCITEGVKSMVPAFIILTLAWTISGVCRDLLSTGEYVGNLVATSHLPVQLIPAIIFVVAGFLAFSMGTSWGTFGILIPIVVIACQQVAPQLLTVTLAATLAGSVFGDHCSPISDTTILSSTGAGCDHLDHVSSQIPYTVVVAACCLIGYVVSGLASSLPFAANLILTLIVSVLLLAVALVILHKFFGTNRENQNGQAVK